jgi:hypothetical protein
MAPEVQALRRDCTIIMVSAEMASPHGYDSKARA